MSKKLIAVRLPFKQVELLRQMALDSKKSQAEIVSEGIALYQMKVLYTKGNGEKKTTDSYTEKSKGKWVIC